MPYPNINYFRNQRGLGSLDEDWSADDEKAEDSSAITGQTDFMARGKAIGMAQQVQNIADIPGGTDNSRQMLNSAASLASSLAGGAAGSPAEMAKYPGARTAPRGNPGTPASPNKTATGGKIFGMSTNEFSQLAGGLGSAIAGDTPMGRAGAFVSQYAGQKIAREQQQRKTLAERQAKIAAATREREHLTKLANIRETGATDRLEKSLEQSKYLAGIAQKNTLAERQAKIAAATREQTHDTNLANIRETGATTRADIASTERQNIAKQKLDALGKTIITGKDGGLHIIDKNTGKAVTVKGVTAEVQEQYEQLSFEDQYKLNTRIYEAALNKADYIFDSVTGDTRNKDGNLISAKEKAALQQYANNITASVLKVLQETGDKNISAAIAIVNYQEQVAASLAAMRKQKAAEEAAAKKAAADEVAAEKEAKRIAAAKKVAEEEAAAKKAAAKKPRFYRIRFGDSNGNI